MVLTVLLPCLLVCVAMVPHTCVFLTPRNNNCDELTKHAQAHFSTMIVIALCVCLTQSCNEGGKKLSFWWSTCSFLLALSRISNKRSCSCYCATGMKNRHDFLFPKNCYYPPKLCSFFLSRQWHRW